VIAQVNVTLAMLAAATAATMVAAFLLYKYGGLERLKRSVAGLRLLCSRCGYMPATVYSELARYGPQGRATYLSFLISDAIFVPVYAATLTLAVTYFARSQFGLALDSPLPLLALLAGIGDWIEDASLGTAAGRFPERHDRVVLVAAAGTWTKWIFIGLSVVIVGLGLLMSAAAGLAHLLR
jgi:hypothetical protein